MLVLASSSPRRRDLLLEAGIEHVVREPSAPEVAEGDPTHIVVENARAKARSVRSDPGDLIIGCDTVVQCGDRLLGKPRDREDAWRMIEMQIGSPSKVVSGLCLIDTKRQREAHGYEISIVILEGGPSSIDKHLDLDLWQGKAGAFGIQDGGPINARLFSGEEDNVIGLPMTLLHRLLALAGYDYPADTPSSGGV